MTIRLVSIVTFFTLLQLNAIGQSKFSRKTISRYSEKIKSENFTNFYKVSDSLFRSEQPKNRSKEELQRLGIQSILNLRDDLSDSSLIETNEFYLYNVKMKANNIQRQEIDEVLQIIKIAPKPLLIHCKHGSDRTGVVVAIYRIREQNWTKQMAIFEMKKGGFGFHDKYLNIPKFIKSF
ncbi:MAG: tyrosine-protein phosphatase [Leadbetterella sp.]|nr:tyrosine-protein phosphatase [Leadbetterella sp.]